MSASPQCLMAHAEAAMDQARESGLKIDRMALAAFQLAQQLLHALVVGQKLGGCPGVA
jgi:hypothetical protein